MAKQIGFVKVRGTIGGITFYKLNGGYYARRKTSLCKERVLRDAAFAGSRRSSVLFGAASKLAKIIYGRLPIKKKGHGVIGKLTANANRMLHEGMLADEALELLLEKYVGASAKVMLEGAGVERQVKMRRIGDKEVDGMESGVTLRDALVCQQDFTEVPEGSG